MPVYLAFLRAINVGGHTIKMEQLRRHFEALGLMQVETFINSGNVIFAAKAGKAASLEKKLEAHLSQALGYSTSVFLRTPAQLAAVVAYEPFPEPPAGGSQYIAFVQAPVSAEAQKKLAALDSPDDHFHAHGTEVYWWRSGGLSDSPLSGSGKFEKLLGVPATLRNVTTVRKLAEKYPK
jgi:uncharacterized protein (DUF1697 family)